VLLHCWLLAELGAVAPRFPLDVCVCVPALVQLVFLPARPLILEAAVAGGWSAGTQAMCGVIWHHVPELLV